MTDPLAYTVSHSSASILPPMTWTICCQNMTWGSEIHQNGRLLFLGLEKKLQSLLPWCTRAGQMLLHIFLSYVFHIVTVQSIVPCRWYSDWRGLNLWRAEFQFSYWPLCMATFMKPLHEGQSSCCSAQDVYLFTWAILPVFIRSYSNNIGDRNAGLLAEMTWHVLLRSISCLKPCDFCLCDIHWYKCVSIFSSISRWVLFTIAHCQSDGSSHICACVCVCGWVCILYV